MPTDTRRQWQDALWRVFANVTILSVTRHRSGPLVCRRVARFQRKLSGNETMTRNGQPGGRTPHRLSRAFFGREGGVESGPGFQHGAGDIEKAVGDRSQGSAMAVTSASEGGIFRAASGVMLNRDARPVVHGVGEPIMASLSSYHYAAFARPLGDRRDPCQTAQGGVISSLQSIEGFSEQRGKDDPSHSRQGCEDRHVMLLPLSQPGLLRRNEPGSEGIKLAMRLPELLVDEPDARDERRDMRACGLGCSSGDLHRRLAQHVQDMRGVEAPDAIALQDLGNRRLSDANCFVGRRRGLPQVEQPLRPEIAFKIKHRWK